VDSACKGCGAQAALTFELPAEELATAIEASPDAVVRVNRTGEPSRIIDVSGWVTLFSVVAEGAGRTADKAEARRLGYEAAQCLDEALRFYEPENDLPPESAFFSEASLHRHREHPQQLARTRLINLRAKLPTWRRWRSAWPVGSASDGGGCGGKCAPWPRHEAPTGRLGRDRWWSAALAFGADRLGRTRRRAARDIRLRGG